MQLPWANVLNVSPTDTLPGAGLFAEEITKYRGNAIADAAARVREDDIADTDIDEIADAIPGTKYHPESSRDLTCACFECHTESSCVCMHIVSVDWKLVPSVCYFTWENPDNILSCVGRESCSVGEEEGA